MPDVAALTRVCQSCGLCCNGTLFRQGKLRPDEVETAKKNRLVVIDDGPFFSLPCPRFDAEHKSCTVYEERPNTCRGFECRLLARFAREGGPIEAPLEGVRRVKEIIALLEAKGMDMSPGAPRVVSGDGDDAFEIFTLFTELMERLERDFERAPDTEG
ncbi:MAG: YkgJ family cysteine cluster protein [Myxococcales bacterium]|nr:YkgJ family cysteine cluster protein [Myxococcales bacterium]